VQNLHICKHVYICTHVRTHTYIHTGERYDQWCKIAGQKSSAGMLRVLVRRAVNLPAMDRNGTSDPYCLLRFVDEHGKPNSRSTRDLCSHGGLLWQTQGVQTPVVSANLCPIWEVFFSPPSLTTLSTTLPLPPNPLRLLQICVRVVIVRVYIQLHVCMHMSFGRNGRHRCSDGS